MTAESSLSRGHSERSEEPYECSCRHCRSWDRLKLGPMHVTGSASGRKVLRFNRQMLVAGALVVKRRNLLFLVTCLHYWRDADSHGLQHAHQFSPYYSRSGEEKFLAGFVGFTNDPMPVVEVVEQLRQLE